MSFDYTQEEITRLAKENNFTVAGIEKVMRLSNILNDLNNQPEFSGKLLLKGNGYKPACFRSSPAFCRSGS